MRIIRMFVGLQLASVSYMVRSQVLCNLSIKKLLVVLNFLIHFCVLKSGKGTLFAASHIWKRQSVSLIMKIVHFVRRLGIGIIKM